MTDEHPQLALLTGEDVGDLVACALEPAGGQPERWRIDQVDHQPGGDTTVTYRTRVRWPDGVRSNEVIGAVAGSVPDGTVRLTDGRTDVGMWRFPHDPGLPALPDACDPDRVAALTGVRPLGLRLRSYRPRRRAVVEARTAAGALFLKVVPPGRLDRLHCRHRIAADAGCPVPEPIAHSATGLLAVTGLAGTTLRRRIDAADAVLDDPGAVPRLLDGLPHELADGTVRTTWGQRAGFYAGVLAETLPALADQARMIADAVDHTEPEGELTVVHGDFYESQLMMSGDAISGLLDIDTVGRGERLDDLGCLLGHLSVLAQLWPARAALIDDLGRRLFARFVCDVDPAALARRAAAVVLSLATGPRRVAERDWQHRTQQRVALAQAWLEADEEVFTETRRSAS